LKIAYILVSSMTVLFLIYAIHAYLTFEVNLQEVKEAVSLRNEAQANNIMQGLDKFIDERITDIRKISNSKRILDILSDSNREFSQIKDLESFLEQKESEIEFTVMVPSSVGELHYYCRAKNKKKCNEGDLSTAFFSANSKKLPILFLTTGEVTKKAIDLTKTEFRSMTMKNI